MSQHTEIAFEIVIVDSLLAGGYEEISCDGFDRERASFPEVVLEFIRSTQPKQWEKLEALHGAKTGERIIQDLCDWLVIEDQAVGDHDHAVKGPFIPLIVK